VIKFCSWATICLSNKTITILFLAGNTTGETLTVRAFIKKKKEKKLYKKRRATTMNKASRGSLKNQTAKQENLYKEEKQYVCLHSI